MTFAKLWGYAVPFAKMLLILVIGHIIIVYIQKLFRHSLDKSKLDKSKLDPSLIRFTDKVNVHLAEKETQILNYLNQDPGYTVTALSELMGISRKSVAGYLKNLKDKEIIERVEFSRKGYWIINL